MGCAFNLDRVRHSMLYRQALMASAIAVLLLALTSCGGTGRGLYPVYGKATYKGEPAAGAYLVLIRDGPAPPGAPDIARQEPPSATVEEDGSFTVSCGELGYGAPPGKYKVLFDWRTGLAADAVKAQEAAEKEKMGRRARSYKADKHSMLAPDRLKGRYANPANPLLTVEIKPQTNNLPPFELTD
jgi:hypothetical protein